MATAPNMNLADAGARAAFKTMRDGTEDDWKIIGAEHAKHQQERQPDVIMEQLARLGDMQVGFRADQLTHSLMCATLARRSGASPQEVVAALCHDLGKAMSIPNHGAIAAEILQPYVDDYIYHAIKWHQHFQGKYYYNHMGLATDMREQFKNEDWYAFAVKLVDDWDAPAFDDGFECDSLESFRPEVTEVFTKPKRMAG
ncbi:HD domain-containing protein [Pacificimonas sp. WHA3]|uniref:HD domain-containing protein n=1 Tax=Pacificimonas pallii TaxID=2827236 RepID=A0ABS6SBM2_9SPHN|nr:HD domain-containing protein [Pacificimonas pallii]MBV7255769.1 HD domain-containing protein [Pacificimonas pallii]